MADPMTACFHWLLWIRGGEGQEGGMGWRAEESNSDEKPKRNKTARGEKKNEKANDKRRG